jgi:hypothetical protein
MKVAVAFKPEVYTQLDAPEVRGFCRFGLYNLADES